MIDFYRLINWLSGTIEKEAATPAATADRRRFQRLNLKECRLFINQSGPFPILNLSYGGMRADLSQYEEPLQTGQEIDCDIFLENILINNRLTIRNIENNLVGCSFSRMSVTESRILKDFLKPRILGFSLREIESARLRNDTPELKMRWFQGEDNTQIFLWQTVSGENVMQEFYFLDYYISWQQDSAGIKTGMIKESARKTFGRLTPDAIAFFKIPSYRALKLGQTILSCSRLPDDAKEKLLFEIAGEEKRLYHRYLIKEKEAFFTPENRPEMKIPVLNLSLHGAAILNCPELVFSPKTMVKGSLSLEKFQMPASFCPVYIEKQFSGGSLEIAPDKLAAFSEFLAPRLLAQYLEKVPAPIEIPFFAAPGSQTSLFTGLHNTHILSLIDSEGELITGRILFMDTLIRYHQKSLTQHQVKEGIVFPGDWEIPLQLLKGEEPAANSAVTFCRELLSNARIPEETRQAWIKVL